MLCGHEIAVMLRKIVAVENNRSAPFLCQLIFMARLLLLLMLPQAPEDDPQNR